MQGRERILPGTNGEFNCNINSTFREGVLVKTSKFTVKFGSILIITNNLRRRGGGDRERKKILLWNFLEILPTIYMGQGECAIIQTDKHVWQKIKWKSPVDLSYK